MVTDKQIVWFTISFRLLKLPHVYYLYNSLLFFFYSCQTKNDEEQKNILFFYGIKTSKGVAI